MKALIQRVSKASVKIKKKNYSFIGRGMVVFLGINKKDSEKDVEQLSNKILNLRIFPDNKNKMNYSIKDIQGEVLLISQFTLYADCKKGNRPSFVNAANATKAKPLYDLFVQHLNSKNISIKTGIFKEEMDIELINKGPVTIMLKSKDEK